MNNETVICFFKQLKNLIMSNPSWIDSAKTVADEAFDKAFKAKEFRKRGCADDMIKRYHKNTIL